MKNDRTLLSLEKFSREKREAWEMSMTSLVSRKKALAFGFILWHLSYVSTRRFFFHFCQADGGSSFLLSCHVHPS